MVISHKISGHSNELVEDDYQVINALSRAFCVKFKNDCSFLPIVSTIKYEGLLV